jgi:hypothetical protein
MFTKLSRGIEDVNKKCIDQTSTHKHYIICEITNTVDGINGRYITEEKVVLKTAMETMQNKTNEEMGL